MLPALILIAAGVYWRLREERQQRRAIAARAAARSDDSDAVPDDAQVRGAEKSSLLNRAEDKTQALILTAMRRTGVDARRQQQAMLVSEAGEVAAPLTERDRQQNRELLVGIGTVGLAAAGRLLFPPLSILVAPLFAYLSVPVYRKAISEVKDDKRINLSGLVAVFTTGSWLLGAKVIASLGLLSLNVAEKISSLTQDRTRKTLRRLFAQHQSKVFVFRDGVEVEVPLEAVRVGDELALRAGQVIPVDGIVTHGMATVDQHQLTGESELIEKGIADRVLSATFIRNGQLRVQVEKAGSDTLAAQTSALLERTTRLHLEHPERGLRLANRTVAPSLLITAAVLPFYGLRSSMALLAVMPGVDMYYAGPLALLSFLEMAAERQILIKDGRSLELLRSVDTVIFDKTGTLTLEQPELAQIHVLDDLSEDEILGLAAAAEYGQTHPIANAILAAARRRGLPIEDVFVPRYEVGFGIEARAGKRRIRIGSERFMAAERLHLPAHAKQVRPAANQRGHSLVYVASGKRVVGALELRPSLRPDAKEVVEDLRRRGLTLYILSGDQLEPTARLAGTLGIDNHFAGVLPSEKAAIVERLQREGRKICFVGDGVNDAIALKKADVSISIQGATLMATDTAQIVLMSQSLRGLPQVLDLARALERNVNTSFGISLGVAGALLVTVLLLKGHIGLLLATGSASLSLVTANALASRWTYKDRQPEDLREPAEEK